MRSQAFIERLGKAGLSVFPRFLSAQLLLEARNDLEALRVSRRFQKAGTGSKLTHTADNRKRTDETFWLSRGPSTPCRDRLWRKIDRLQQQLNRTLYLGLGEFQGHYAAYANGGFYRRHLDSARGGRSRVVSFILYLNLSWQTADAGSLRVYEADESYRDIAPIGGTLVCFLSQEKEHEVLLSHADRFSLTGWFGLRETQ